jgi:anti-sigma B factor antagonist
MSRVKAAPPWHAIRGGAGHYLMTEHRPFSVKFTRESNEIAAVRATGELDLESCPYLRLCLDEALHEGAYRVIVDLTGATFIDSAAMGVILSCGRCLAAREAHLEICCRANQVERALKVTGFDRIFLMRVQD